MKQLKTALFDFDGVVVETEPIYDIFWNEVGERFGLGIDHFASVIKGTTFPYILEKYFAGYSESVKNQVVAEAMNFEKSMSFPPIPGSLDFLALLKENGVKMGLVTSSTDLKVKRAFEILHLESLFDTVVTADRITQGKPHPMCYLLAASDLNVPPSECLVFEDSFAGIQAGTNAGMRVIGLSTTNTEDMIKEKVYKVIPDFKKITFHEYTEW